MINELEYRTEDRFGAVRVLHADKNVTQKNAWHLASISGNALPPISTLGAATFGLPGKGYHGTQVGAREIEATLYADGADASGLRYMLDEVPQLLSAGDDRLGLLRLTNDAGEIFRIKAKCTELNPDKLKSRTGIFSAVFDCPYPYFESDTLFREQIIAVEGGKEYPLDRPYTFGNVQPSTSTTYTVYCNNQGDAPAPCVIKIYGSGISYVRLYNHETNKSIYIENMSVANMEISTDPDNLYSIYGTASSAGLDATKYIRPGYPISEFTISPGVNKLSIIVTASNIEPAGTCIEWRGRYSACL